MRFKIGDRVMYVGSDDYYNSFNDMIGTVVEIDEMSDGAHLVDFEEEVYYDDNNDGLKRKISHNCSGKLIGETGYWFFDDKYIDPSIDDLVLVTNENKEVQFEF